MLRGGQGRRRRLLRGAVAAGEEAVFTFDLQVGQATDGLGSEGGIRPFLQKTLVARHRLIEAAFDLFFLDLDALVPQLGNRPPVVDRAAGDKNDRQGEDEKSLEPH